MDITSVFKVRDNVNNELYKHGYPQLYTTDVYLIQDYLNLNYSVDMIVNDFISDFVEEKDERKYYA